MAFTKIPSLCTSLNKKISPILLKFILYSIFFSLNQNTIKKNLTMEMAVGFQSILPGKVTQLSHIWHDYTFQK